MAIHFVSVSCFVCILRPQEHFSKTNFSGGRGYRGGGGLRWGWSVLHFQTTGTFFKEEENLTTYTLSPSPIFFNFMFLYLLKPHAKFQWGLGSVGVRVRHGGIFFRFSF